MIVTVKIISTVSSVMLITHCSIREPLFTLIESAAFCNTGSGVLDSGDLSSGTEQCLQIWLIVTVSIIVICCHNNHHHGRSFPWTKCHSLTFAFICPEINAQTIILQCQWLAASTWVYVMTTPFWTQGPLAPSSSAGHRYVLIVALPVLELWKRTWRSAW